MLTQFAERISTCVSRITQFEENQRAVKGDDSLFSLRGTQRTAQGQIQVVAPCLSKIATVYPFLTGFARISASILFFTILPGLPQNFRLEISGRPRSRGGPCHSPGRCPQVSLRKQLHQLIHPLRPLQLRHWH